MRKIKYKKLPCVGEETISTEGDLLQFVQDIPYLFTFNLIPPINVLNDIFKSGLEDAGMSGGCQWEPFEINQDEYDELIISLQNLSKNNYKVVFAPKWVKTKTDWHIWKSKYELGIPTQKHYKLWKENDKWEKLREEASEQRDEELAMQYHLKAIESGNKLAEFIEPYIRKYHKKRNIC